MPTTDCIGGLLFVHGPLIAITNRSETIPFLLSGYFLIEKAKDGVLDAVDAEITRGRSKKAAFVLVIRDRQDLKNPESSPGLRPNRFHIALEPGSRGNFDFPAIDHQKQILSQ